ncbi:MAG: GNAT family N-acetyltransferase [Dehalococcoidia bacterium]
MPIAIRTIERDELEAFSRCQNMAFGRDFRPESMQGREETFEFDRNLAAVDGSNIVGTAGIYSFEMGVPGGSLPTAGVTMVAVKPTHRRRGVLTNLMATQLQQITDRGEALAALWASESSIYQRFGYGLASERATLRLPRVYATFSQPVVAKGDLRQLESSEVAESWPTFRNGFVTKHAGFLSRHLAGWRRLLRDEEEWRDGYTANVYINYEVGGELRGYVRYRVKPGWNERDLPTGTVKVEELLALDNEAYRALWQYVFGVDLVDKIEAPFRRSDEPLYYQMADPRRLERIQDDALWLRIVDVEGALAGRRYSAEGRLAIQVTDSFRPETSGTYVLEGGPGGASCWRTDTGADLSMSIADLGAIYLGGTRLATLAEAGRVRGDREALAKADLMFQSSAAPWCPMMF